MQIRIFTGTPCEVERRVNRFAKTVHVVGIKQSVCCEPAVCEPASPTVIVTVLYYEHCEHRFYGIRL